MLAKWLRRGAVAAFAFALQVHGVAWADPLEYTAGHLDIGVAYEDDELHLHYHFGGDAVLDGVMGGGEFELDAVYTRVADSLYFPSAPLNLVNLGSASGPAWVLPQTNEPGVPFMGFSTEELAPGLGPTRFQMTGFTGPGEFALWTFGFGASIYWDTFGSGVDPTDYLDLPTGTHAHYAWGFTAPGVYYVDISATSVNNPSLTDSGTLIFLVGDNTTFPAVVDPSPVPEPGSLAMMGIGALVMGGGYLRRRRPSTSDDDSMVGPSESEC